MYTEATITPEKARELAQQYRVLTLANATAVSPAVAEALVIRGGGTVLTLPAIATLNEEAATILAQRPGRLRLWGLKAVTPEVAAAIVAHDGPLSLNRLKRLEPGVVDILAKQRFPVLLMLEEIDSVPLARKIFCLAPVEPGISAGKG